MSYESNPDTTPAILVQALSKVYHLYARHGDRVKEALDPRRRKFHTDFYALHDINFRVESGEALGIIGRNGSGKSTLLKIITGVLTPTCGTVVTQGTISALLELGAGFNPDQTGMENIFFSGTILGLERDIIESMVPEIVAFADIGPHIHQPVKTYSSGMFARLAFAVAVNVDPDILIVDEALSVGDMRFQQKCIRKMQGFRNAGKTILFVTHDTAGVTSFCDRALWLDQGRIREIGLASQVCKRYTAFMAYGDHVPPDDPELPPRKDPPREPPAPSPITWQDLSNRESFGTGEAKLVQAAMVDAEHKPVGSIRPGQIVRLLMTIKAYRMIPMAGCGFLVKNRLGQPIFTLNSYFSDELSPRSLPEGITTVAFEFHFPHLVHGQYAVSLAVAEGTLPCHTQLHWVHDALCIEMAGGGPAYASGCLMALPQDAWSIQWETTR